ncbi:MAG: hypothetical protein CMQ43_03740 [Gammaproteobacteria bacterium]|nr:hypothetical protein [Gammaproteobacteria bacterium]
MLRSMVAAALLSACIGPPLHAAESRVVSANELAQPLTLHEAVMEAVDANFAVRQALARVQQQSGALTHAGRWTPSNPEIEVESAEREPASGDSSRDFSIRLSQELWIGGQRGLQRNAAGARLTAAEQDLQFLRSAIAARARRAFLHVLLTQRAEETAGRLVELTETFADYARNRLEAGRATALEVNSAMIGAARSRTELAEAERLSARARLVLAEVLARDPASPLTVRGDIEPWPVTLPNESRLLNAAVRRRGDLAAAAERVEAARQDLRLSRRQLIPNLTVFGFYQEEEDAEITGFGASLPIPALHRYGGEREQAAGRLLEEQLRTDELRLAVRRQVLEALADYRAARRQSELLGTSMLERAEENLRLTREGFEAGKVGSPAITTAQDNLINVRRSYLDALGALILSVTDLERATGGLIVLEDNAQSDKDAAP